MAPTRLRRIGVAVALVLVLAVVLYCLGFGRARCVVRVASAAQSSEPAAVPAVATVRVVRDPKSADPLLDAMIAETLERHMKDISYVCASADSADFLLLFECGVAPSVPSLSGVAHVTVAAPTSVKCIPRSDGREPVIEIGRSGLPIAHRYHTWQPMAADRWLLVRLFDGSEARADGAQRPVWLSYALSSGREADIWRVREPLVAAALSLFPRTSAGWVRLTYRPPVDWTSLFGQTPGVAWKCIAARGEFADGTGGDLKLLGHRGDPADSTRDDELPNGHGYR